ncbi:MAG: hypothetical protein ACO23N_05880 [Opitutales bacterium]
MRLLSLLALLCLVACKPTPEPKLAQPVAVAKAKPARLPVFADPAVNAFVAEADAAARKTAPLTPEFWAWVESHPDVHVGLLFAQHPMPAVHAENLDLLRRSVEPRLADKYAHLLLGVSIGEKLRETSDQPRTEWSPAARKVAAWMKSSGTTYLKVMEDTTAALAAAGVTAAEAKEKGFWSEVAHVSGTYPERLGQGAPEFIRWVIGKLETPAPAGSKLAWPIFPTDRAPWPLLTWFRGTVPAKECEWIWERYWGRVPGLGSGIIGYGRYSWDYDRVPAVKFKASEWHPHSIPRIWEDGGVCGRLSTMGDTFRRALGQPTSGCPQPGHRAFAEYGFDAKNGRWTFGIGQSIAGLEVSSVSPKLPQLAPFEANRAVNCVALTQAMNLGLDRFQRGRILGWFALAQSDAGRRERYIRQSLALNPYELSLWKVLAAGVTDGPAASRLLAEMDKALVTPNSSVEEAAKLSADTDFAKLGGGKVDAKSDRGTQVAKLTGDVLAAEMFGRILASGQGLSEARAALKGEVARRAAQKIAYAPAVADGLVARYDLRVEGLPASLEAARAAVLAADKLKAKARDAAVAQVTARLRALGEGEAKAVSEWAAKLVKELGAAGSRWTLDKKGEPKAEALYAEVHALRVGTLRKQGKNGKAALAVAEREFTAGKPAPAPPAPPAKK